MKLLKNYYNYLAGLVIFCVYLTTIAPTVVDGDTGELATVQCTLGIAHPTGYPLFTILGYLFTLIPLPFTKIFQLNLLCAIWTTLGAAVFIKTSKFILDNITELQSIKFESGKKSFFKETIISGKLSETQKYLIAISSGFILAFSRTFWFQSTSVEVYSLNLFLVNVSLLYILKAYFEKEEKERILSKNWLLSVIFFSLALCNHRSVVYILPGAAYLFFSKYKFNVNSLKKIGLFTIITISIIFVFYLYLLIRASQKPLMNWGDPSSPGALINVFMGKYYKILMRFEVKAFADRFIYFFSTLMINLSRGNLVANEFSLNIVFSFIGLVVSFLFYRRFFVFFMLILTSTIILTSFYIIPDYSSYLLNAYIAVAAFSILGIVTLFFLFLKGISKALIFVLLFICITSQVYSNYYNATLSGCYLTYDISTVLLQNVDKNSIIVTNADYLFPLYYLQYVEGMRKDVIFVSNFLLQFDWYREQLKKFHPDIKYKFKNKYEVDTENRSLYVTAEMLSLIHNKDYNLSSDARLVPDIFLYKVAYNEDYMPVKIPNYKIRYNFDPTYYEFKENYTSICLLVVRLLYEVEHKKYDNAKIILKKIKEAYPKYNLPKKFLASVPELQSN